MKEKSMDKTIVSDSTSQYQNNKNQVMTLS